MKTITDKQRIDFLESLRKEPTDSDIHIHPQIIASFNMYLRGNRHMPGNENNIPARQHHGITFRAMIDDAILSANDQEHATTPAP
jgi:hypothetical protein